MMSGLADWAWIALAVVGVGAAALAGLYAGLPWLIQPLLRVLLRLRYRIRVVGLENLPRSGPALVAANHLTWYDGFFLAASCPRRGRALVTGAYIDWPILGLLARRAGLIPVYFSGPRAQRAMFQACRETLDRGEVLGIFPEGQISRTGLIGPFQRGLEVILSGHEHVPVIPVYLDNLWGSLLSYSEGRFLKKWPKGLRRTVNIVFGPPLFAPVTAFDVRQAVLEAGVQAVALRQSKPERLETVDPALPHLDHPELGPLTGSTADFDRGGIRQTGHKPGTVGLPLPGVALRVVDESGTPQPPDANGRLQALLPGRPGWVETGYHGRIGRDGFVSLVNHEPQGPA
jgi:acyl-[acyl-carrier-protein]-phospholipid O-acyltransferase/long-chain-fatty-acid--[acyl-carrier-protein] ligase